MPKVFGQSGTARPTRYVVTEPPTYKSGSVKTAAPRANKCAAQRNGAAFGSDGLLGLSGLIGCS